MSNRFTVNTNKDELHYDDFEEYKKSSKNPTHEDNQCEMHKKENDVHLWDVFKQFPKRPKSGSTVEKKGYEVILRFLKVCVYLILFSSVLSFSVISKGTILFAVSNINYRYTPFCDYNLDSQPSEGTKLLSSLPKSGQIAWMWCIIIAFIVPEFLGILSAIKVCLFKSVRKEDLPSIQNFLISNILEIFHSIGTALLFLICLPELNVLQTASILSCVCFIPSLLALVRSFTKYLRSPGTKKLLSALVDALAFILQTTGIFASFFFNHRERSKSIYILPVALVLSSIRWWPNYVSSDEKPETWLGKIKKDLESSRFCLQGVTALVRIITFIASATIIAYYKGFILADFFSGFWGKDYVVHVVSFSSVDNSTITKMSLNANTYIQIQVLLIHIFSSLFAYEFGTFACKTLMHRFGFAFPLMLSMPTTIILLILFLGLRNQNTCAFHGIIPDYLFFDVPINAFEIIISEWYIWFSILWWISQTWITFHTWTSSCETLARSERIFAISTYDSLIIDQCLPLNRKKKFGSEKEKKPLKKDLDAKESDRLTIIKACATMWHETEGEMNKLVRSILRLDKDNCAMRVIQNHFNVRIPDYYDLETHIFFDDAFHCVHKCEGLCVNENETQVNEYVVKFVKVVEENLKKMRMRAKPPEKYPTPFGGRLKWTLPGGSNLIVHLKDKNKIRHRKRWSQVMYMYYLLGYNLMELSIDLERKETIAENTYILTLDGDIDFHPNAVKTLIDLMKRDESLGAACGRIHPIGSGPVVWFQKFEYAVGHWLQKSTEHAIGCVLCSPGCFSLFRARALMDYNVMRKYATESTEARHYIQYDQGEDRWLCTLILQKGYRVEYSAASDAYTHAPENFDEFYVQRRRWIPSTMANIFDLLSTSKETRRCNNDISWLYILYQWVLMGATIIGPGTIFLMLVGAIAGAFGIENWSSLCFNLLPIVTFIIVCFVCKESVQLKVAEIISAIYGLIMGVVLVAIVLQITEDGILAPSSLLFFIIACQLIIAGLLHPREWYCLACGFIYYITVPSMYMLLIIFAIFNLHNITWGTRDSKLSEATKSETKDTQKNNSVNNVEDKKDGEISSTKGSTRFSLIGLLKYIPCVNKRKSEEEIKLNKISDMLNRIEERLVTIESNILDAPLTISECINSYVIEKENTNLPSIYKSEKDSITRFKSEKDTVVSEKGSTSFNSNMKSDPDAKISEKENVIYKTIYRSDYNLEDSDYSDNSIHESRIYSGSVRDEFDFIVNPSWMFDTKLGKGGVSYLVTEEETFWVNLIAAYLKPIPMDEENIKKKEKVAAELMSLRNKYIFQFLMLNALFVLMIFLMQLNKDKLHFEWPFGETYNVTYHINKPGEMHITKFYLRLEPIGCVFIVTFVSILFIQFLSMLVHRFETFSHLLAKTSLDWYCCKKSDLPDEAVAIRYRDIFSEYVQKAYDKMILEGENNIKKPPRSRKTLTDLVEHREPFVMESFEGLFHEYLGRTDLAGKLKKSVIEVMKHRSTIEKIEEQNAESCHIYESADALRKTTIEKPYSGKSGINNSGFDSD